MWCDQAKSVWSRSNSVFTFLTNCLHHFHSYILQKTPLKLVNWFQRYEQLKDAKNNRKQKTFFALFGSILKSIYPTSDWFCLITSQIMYQDPSRRKSFWCVTYIPNSLAFVSWFIDWFISTAVSSSSFLRGKLKVGDDSSGFLWGFFSCKLKIKFNGRIIIIRVVKTFTSSRCSGETRRPGTRCPWWALTAYHWCYCWIEVSENTASFETKTGGR